MDNLSHLVRSLIGFLMPFLPYLTGGEAPEKATDIDPYDWKVAKELWGEIEPRIRTTSAIREALLDTLKEPCDEDALASLRFHLRKMMEREPALVDGLTGLLRDSDILETAGIEEIAAVRWPDTLRRLEMIHLLRTGMSPEEIAVRFNADPEYIYRLNAAFSLNGSCGVLSPEPRRWFDNLGMEEPVIRRLEMMRLLRSGTPLRVIAREYGAIPEYIARLEERFRRHGVAGILTDDDFQKYRSVYPEVIRICTYNLHGVHGGDTWLRFRRIARELSALDVDLGSFQEVISGDGIEETSAQIARWMSRTTGYHYRTSFSFCHLFMNKYPEGVSVLARHGYKNIHVIDLNRGLWIGLAPSMDRYAVAAEVEIYGRRVVFVSIHLDHENPKIRLAQAEKLLMELDRLFGERRGDCYILAGDFNDVEDSPVMAFIKASGYTDAYRSCNRFGGATFEAAAPRMRIDFIMVKGDVSFLYANLVPKDPTLSDHLGVVAEIEIKGGR